MTQTFKSGDRVRVTFDGVCTDRGSHVIQSGNFTYSVPSSATLELIPAATPLGIGEYVHDKHRSPVDQNTQYRVAAVLEDGWFTLDTGAPANQRYYYVHAGQLSRPSGIPIKVSK